MKKRLQAKGKQRHTGVRGTLAEEEIEHMTRQNGNKNTRADGPHQRGIRELVPRGWRATHAPDTTVCEETKAATRVNLERNGGIDETTVDVQKMSQQDERMLEAHGQAEDTDANKDQQCLYNRD